MTPVAASLASLPRLRYRLLVTCSAARRGKRRVRGKRQGAHGFSNSCEGFGSKLIKGYIHCHRLPA